MKTPIALLLVAVCLAAIVACDTATSVGVATPASRATATPQASQTAPTIPGRSTPPVADSGCLDYLGLLVSTADQAVEAALNSYRCPNLYVDSTGRYPPADPVLSITDGEALTFLFGPNGEQQPAVVEMRLYAGPGVSGSFLRWPEDLSVGIQPVDSADPPPSSLIQYVPRASPGVYSLVIRAAWEGSVDVFYSVSFTIEAGQVP